MSERMEGTVAASVGRGCAFTALALGAVVNALHATPILALKAGGLLALIVTFALLLLGTRVERASQAKARGRSAAGSAEAGAGSARRRAFQVYASWFAVGAAACLAVALAGEINLILYPPL
jgi:hypothetical protein